MAVAEIITIGTELLLGEIQDTNSKYMARVLRDIGMDLYRLTTIGDNAQRITATLQEALMRSDLIITTGGLGPTVDDPTRKAVADVFNLPLVYHPELWEEILERFRSYERIPTENNKRQAYLPQGAIAIHNEVGTAPAFVYELGMKSIISLPGVPRETEHIMQNFVLNYLKKRYHLRDKIIKSWVIHTVSLGESSIDEIIGEMETYSNPTVGLLAHPGQTDVRVTAKADSAAEAKKMMEPVVKEIREKLGEYIYGENEATIQSAVADLIRSHNLHLAIIESGTGGEICGRLSEHLEAKYLSGQFLDVNFSSDTLKTVMREFRDQEKADIVLGVRLITDADRQKLLVVVDYKSEMQEKERYYAGPPGDGLGWAINYSLDHIRRRLLTDESEPGE